MLASETEQGTEAKKARSMKVGIYDRWNSGAHPYEKLPVLGLQLLHPQTRDRVSCVVEAVFVGVQTG